MNYRIARPLPALRLAALTAALLAAGIASAQQKQPTVEEMWQIIQQQQREIESLKSQQTQTDQKVEAAGDRIEQVATDRTGGGMVDGWWNKTSLGGYGEMHYNGGDKDEIDFHRFVLYLNHQFSDRIRLQTELELEHSIAGDGQPGEIELEQAYLEFDVTDRAKVKAGLFLLPIGILNETHEPNTFFGVERNIVENKIIPTTWWEGGVAAAYDFGAGFSADLAAHSGLKVDPANFTIRGGRQKVGEAPAKDPAFTGRVKWTGMPGVELALSAQYQNDITQSVQPTEATLIETHANIRRGPWSLRALYARWDLDSDAAKALGRDEQYGWYIEPGYIFKTGAGEFGVFARYSEVDNTAGDSTDSKERQTDVGLNYWPHPQVVLKADYQFVQLPAGQNEDNRVNLGVGFMF
jgi:hypothetical protein